MAEERPSLKKPPRSKSAKPEKPSNLQGIKGREYPVPTLLPSLQTNIGGFGLREYFTSPVSRRGSRLSLFSLSDTEVNHSSSSSSSRSSNKFGDQEMMYLDLLERPQTAIPTALMASLVVPESYIPVTVISVMSLSAVMVYTHWPEKSPPRSISVPPEIPISWRQSKSGETYQNTNKTEGASLLVPLSHDSLPSRPKSQLIHYSTGKAEGVLLAPSHPEQLKLGPIYQHTGKVEEALLVPSSDLKQPKSGQHTGKAEETLLVLSSHQNIKADSGTKCEGAYHRRSKPSGRRRTRTISIYPYRVAKQVENELQQSQSEYLQVIKLTKEKSPSPPPEVSC